MAQLLKKYRLTRGKHRVVNPEFQEGRDGPELSHHLVKAEDNAEILLTDSQYAAFRDKFEPIDSLASDVKTAEADKLAAAKIRATQTGQSVNPNPRTS